MTDLHFIPVDQAGRARFIGGVQTAFALAAKNEFAGFDGEAIFARDIEESLDGPHAEAFFIKLGSETVGGVCVQIDEKSGRNSLDLLYIAPAHHGRGLGLAVWLALQARYPDTEVWETHTPYFEKRNIHFYVNKCGFQIVEFFNPKHPDPHAAGSSAPGGEYFFRFEKRMKGGAVNVQK